MDSSLYRSNSFSPGAGPRNVGLSSGSNRWVGESSSAIPRSHWHSRRAAAMANRQLGLPKPGYLRECKHAETGGLSCQRVDEGCRNAAAPGPRRQANSGTPCRLPQPGQSLLATSTARSANATAPGAEASNRATGFAAIGASLTVIFSGITVLKKCSRLNSFSLGRRSIVS